MKKKIFRILFFIGILLSVHTVTNAQKVETENSLDFPVVTGGNMNIMYKGDENSFFVFKPSSRTSRIDKYNKKTMELLWSTPLISLEKNSKVKNVFSINGEVYIFNTVFDSLGQKAILKCILLSSLGKMNEQVKKFAEVKTPFYTQVDFNIQTNPGNNSFLIYTLYKPDQNKEMIANFFIINTLKLRGEWMKSRENLLSGYDFTFNAPLPKSYEELAGITMDDSGKIYFCYKRKPGISESAEDAEPLILGILNAGNAQKLTSNAASVTTTASSSAASKAFTLPLPLEKNYQVYDVGFIRNISGELVICGFFKDQSRPRGKDLTLAGCFAFKVDLSSYNITSRALRFFDVDLLINLESDTTSGPLFNYKLDYLLPVENDIYLIGEQFQEKTVRGNSETWDYQYRNVIISRLSSSDLFEWIISVPLRNSRQMKSPDLCNPYFPLASNEKIFIFKNDHPENIEKYQNGNFLRGIQSISTPKGSIFNYESISLSKGQFIENNIVKTDQFFFSANQSRDRTDVDVFIKGKTNEAIYYSEGESKGHYSKITISE
jgi:hypothetical protein